MIAISVVVSLPRDDYRCQRRDDLETSGIFMSKFEQRYERALAALKVIAQTMSNVVFRVEDYRPPQQPLSQRDGSRSNQLHAEKEKRTPTKRAIRNG
jgi:hypothetical protein